MIIDETIQIWKVLHIVLYVVINNWSTDSITNGDQIHYAPIWQKVNWKTK